MFGEPFSSKLVNWLEGSVRKALKSAGGETKLFTDKCIVCMEGPQFSTRAESLMYRQWGGDLINMSVLPEAKLAREAELRFFFCSSINPLHHLVDFFLYINSYALIATATDYDSWRPHSDSVTASEVFKTLKANADTSRLVISTILDDLHASLTGEGANVLLQEVGSMKLSIMPRSGKLNEENRKKLAYVLPEYFSEESPNRDVSSV